MNLSEINETQIKVLSKLNFNLNHLWVLHTLYTDEFAIISGRQILKLLEDRGLIGPHGLTKGGRELYEKIRDTKKEEVTPKSKKEKVAVEDNGWEAWWTAFPSSANFSFRGMQFNSSRGLRANKQVCQLLYNKVIAQGVKPEEMLNALNHQVNLMKEESWESGKNKLEYMSNSETYIRQGKYEPFLNVGEEQDEQPMDNSWA